MLTHMDKAGDGHFQETKAEVNGIIIFFLKYSTVKETPASLFEIRERIIMMI